MNVPLPEEAWPYIKVQTNDCVFLNVDAVSDPKVRQLWEKDIEDNHKNAMLNSEQRALAEMKEHYGNRIAKAINVLSKDEETSADSNGKHQGPANVDSGKVNVSGSDKGPYAFDAGGYRGYRVRPDCHSRLPQVRQAKLGRTNSGRSYIVKKSTYD